MKKIIRIALIVLLTGVGLYLIFMPKSERPGANKPTILASSYIGYDFTRSIIKGTYDTELQLLIAPGTDLHSYEPTPEDIIKIKQSSIIIYNGGESESWLTDILKDIDTNKTKLVRMMDAVELLTESDENILEHEEHEEHDEHKEHEHTEYDEHIWTSPKNAKNIINHIAATFISKYPQNSTIYRQNIDAITSDLDALDKKFTELAKNTTAKIYVADRFPFRYLVEDYNLNYLAAFPGCSEQTEASAKTIASMIDSVKQTGAKYIFHIELSTKQTAKTIAEATGAEMLELHSMHNISQSDFAGGKTYLDFMNSNYDNLKKALIDAPANE